MHDNFTSIQVNRPTELLTIREYTDFVLISHPGETQPPTLSGMGNEYRLRDNGIVVFAIKVRQNPIQAVELAYSPI